MKKIFHILRRESAGSASYWEDFSFETEDESVTVAAALSELRESDRIGNGQGHPYRPVVWERSCLQKRCGACAMVINSMPRLACDTPLASLPGGTVTLEPLRKFPVVEDLLTDRSVMMNRLKVLKVWLKEDAVQGSENMAFDASGCLQCGICLEACPNFAAEGKFGGMAAMAPLARLIARLPDSQKPEVSKNYQKGVFNGCGTSLACRDVCPVQIPIGDLLVRSNAAAVWKRWRAAQKDEA